MSLQVAIVGCGAVAQRLYRRPLQQLQRSGLVDIRVLVDPVEANAAAMAAAFRKARLENRLESVFATPIDLTLVLSPAHLHREHALGALKNGSHVFCEKPMASTAAECQEMVEVARSADRLLGVGMIRRFFPAFSELRRIVRSGQLGRLKSFEYREGHKFEWDVTTPAAFRPRREGGTGVLFDIGPHVIDLLAWIFGPLTVAAYSDDAMLGVESNASMEILAGGCRGQVRLSWDYPAFNELRVAGDAAEVVVRVDRFDQIAIRSGRQFEPVPVIASFPTDARAQSPSRRSPRNYTDAMLCQLVQMIRAIHLGESPASDGQSGLECVRLLESALTLAEPMLMPWLGAPEAEAFRLRHWKALS